MSVGRGEEGDGGVRAGWRPASQRTGVGQVAAPPARARPRTAPRMPPPARPLTSKDAKCSLATTSAASQVASAASTSPFSASAAARLFRYVGFLGSASNASLYLVMAASSCLAWYSLLPSALSASARAARSRCARASASLQAPTRTRAGMGWVRRRAARTSRAPAGSDSAGVWEVPHSRTLAALCASDRAHAAAHALAPSWQCMHATGHTPATLTAHARTHDSKHAKRTAARAPDAPPRPPRARARARPPARARPRPCARRRRRSPASRRPPRPSRRRRPRAAPARPSHAEGSVGARRAAEEVVRRRLRRHAQGTRTSSMRGSLRYCVNFSGCACTSEIILTNDSSCGNEHGR